MDAYPKQYLYRRIVRAKLFIDQNFASRIDLSNVSREACFSKFHFARLFRTVYGMSPHQYLTSVRIDAAEKLLMEGATVKEACFRVGFDSVASFTGLFKRRTGHTPAAYQSLHIAVRSDVAAAPLKYIPNCFAESKGWSSK
jgi:AraC-like DNA-binding protein